MSDPDQTISADPVLKACTSEVAEQRPNLFYHHLLTHRVLPRWEHCTEQELRVELQWTQRLPALDSNLQQYFREQNTQVFLPRSKVRKILIPSLEATSFMELPHHVSFTDPVKYTECAEFPCRAISKRKVLRRRKNSQNCKCVITKTFPVFISHHCQHQAGMVQETRCI